MLLSTAFFPPVSWFAAAATEDKVYLEACENYQKQSYRNRCRIAAAQGVESLSVPVVHEGGTFKLPITKIKVDYSEPWIHKFRRAVDSAYESSPFLEYYRDELYAILDTRPETLWELNLSVIRFFMAKTGLKVNILPTKTFTPDGSGIYGEDFREAIHPKRDDLTLRYLQLGKPYFQVFAGKYGFAENLSVMDLLFNMGPESLLYLKKV